MHISIFDSPTKHQGGIPMKRLTALLLSLLLGLSLCVIKVGASVLDRAVGTIEKERCSRRSRGYGI